MPDDWDEVSGENILRIQLNESMAAREALRRQVKTLQVALLSACIDLQNHNHGFENHTPREWIVTWRHLAEEKLHG